MAKNGIERTIGRLEGKIDSLGLTITELKNAFDSLEKGRLSTLEINFAKFYTEIHTKAKNTAMWISALVAIVVSVVSAMIIYSLQR